MIPIITVENLYVTAYTGKVEIPILKDVVALIQHDPGITAKALARQLEVRRPDLSGAVRLLTGKGIDDLLMIWRMMRALELLRTTTDDLATVAQKCGYTCAKHLANAMTRELRLTPYEYRKGYRRGVQRPVKNRI